MFQCCNSHTWCFRFLVVFFNQVIADELLYDKRTFRHDWGLLWSTKTQQRYLLALHSFSLLDEGLPPSIFNSCLSYSKVCKKQEHPRLQFYIKYCPVPQCWRWTVFHFHMQNHRHSSLFLYASLNICFLSGYPQCQSLSLSHSPFLKATVTLFSFRRPLYLSVSLSECAVISVCTDCMYSENSENGKRQQPSHMETPRNIPALFYFHMSISYFVIGFI